MDLVHLTLNDLHYYHYGPSGPPHYLSSYLTDGDSVAEHLNAFNTMVSQLVSVEIKISDEDKCISLLCYLPNSWDSLVMAIGSNTTSLKFEEVVSSLLLEEM